MHVNNTEDKRKNQVIQLIYSSIFITAVNFSDKLTDWSLKKLIY